MTTTPDTIATMHPQDLRSAWRGRPAAKMFSTSPGTRSCQIRKGAVVWSWRPNDTHPRVASTVHVYREGGQLFLHVSDHVPGKHDRVVSKRQRLHTWAELERAVGMLVDGGLMVPRIQESSPFPCGGPSSPLPDVEWTEVEAEMRRQGLDPDAELAKATAAYSTTSPCACGGPASLVSYGDRGERGTLRRICPKCAGTANDPGFQDRCPGASEFTDAEADACSRIFGGGL